MLRLNYKIHLILQSKYKLYLIVLAIYSLYYGNNIIYCMNENNFDQIAKIPKDLDNVIQGLEEQIRSLKIMRNSILTPLDTVVEPIAEAKSAPSHQVLALKREIMTYAGSNAHYLDRIEEQERIIAEQKQTIDRLTSSIKGTIKKRCALPCNNTGDTFF